MRNAFAQQLVESAAADARVVLLSGDIGNRLFDPFKERFPDRFFNCGVAEANMMSVAAGMAMSGLRPIVYTITPFVTARCLEQIRVDVCYHNVPVVIVGVGAGLSYAGLGATHHSCEDIAMLRVLPNMTVVCPGDPCEVRLALSAALKLDGPAYLRIGKKGEPVVHQQSPNFQIGKSITVCEGNDGTLICTGNLLPSVLEAAQLLKKENISMRVVSMHTVKPLDEALLTKAFATDKVVATIEEHSILGGLGSAVAEWLADRRPRKSRLLRFGSADRFLHEAGDQTHARKHFGLTPAQLAQTILTEAGLNG